MTNSLKNIDISEILFIDVTTVRRNDTLTDGPEFDLFQYKMRNQDTGELPCRQEVIDSYNRTAGGKMGFCKIATITLAFINKGELKIKVLHGDEETILHDFFKITLKFKYLCGYGILGYSLPMIYFNASKIFDYTQEVSDTFITSGKKPWELKSIIDLMDVIKGTHYANISFNEALFNYNLPLINNHKPEDYSDLYYKDLQTLLSINKEKLFQTVNLYRKITFNDIFDHFTDSTITSNDEQDDYNIMSILYHNNNFTDTVKNMIQNKLKGKKLTKKDKDFLKDLLISVYVRKEFMNEDTKSREEEKLKEINQFIEQC